MKIVTLYHTHHLPDCYRSRSVRIAPCRWHGYAIYLLLFEQQNMPLRIYLLLLLDVCVVIVLFMHDASDKDFIQIPIAHLLTLTTMLAPRGFVHRIL